MPPEGLDAAIIYATDGALVPLALKAVRKVGRVVCAGSPPAEHEMRSDGQERPAVVISVPWHSPAFIAVKGIIAAPAEEASVLKSETRDAILAAIANARSWLDELTTGRAASIAEIAEREGKVERYVRLLLPLAFAAPTLVKAIADGAGPANMTVTGLAKKVSLSWAIVPGRESDSPWTSNSTIT